MLEAILVESPFTVIVNAEAVSLIPNPAPEAPTDVPLGPEVLSKVTVAAAAADGIMSKGNAIDISRITVKAVALVDLFEIKNSLLLNLF